MSIELVTPSNHLIPCHHLLLLHSIFPSIRVFSNESALCTRWPKYWSFGFNISPSNEDSGLISFRMDWSDLLAFQGTLKSLLQHHSPKASILQHSVFLTLTSTHDYWKDHSFDYTDLCWQNDFLAFKYALEIYHSFPSKEYVSFNLISWLQSPSTVILEHKNIKSVTVSTFPPSVCQEVMGLDAMILVFFNVEFQASFFTLLSLSSRGF